MKGFFKSLEIAHSFNATMKRLRNSLNKKATIKVKITEAQIGILEYCAFLGIDDYFHLVNLTKIEMPIKEISIRFNNKDDVIGL